MARNDSQDQEQEVERNLREYFAAERSGVRAPDDLWQRLESRLGEQSNPSRFVSIGEKLFPRAGRLWSPAFATAGVAAVTAVVTVSVWAAAGGFSGEGPQEELVSSGGRGAEGATRATAEGHGLSQLATEGPNTVAMAPTRTPAAAALEEAEASVPEAAPLPLLPTTASASPDAMEEAAASAPEATLSPPPTTLAVSVSGAQGDAHWGLTGKTGAAGPQGPQGPQAGSPPDTVFKDYGRLPFVATADDHVSTFSLDTDRTSYQLALNWALNGYQVEPESVRAEEWVNAFDYGYNPPSNHREFAVSSDITRHPLDSRLHLARVAFQAPEVRDDTPLNVTLVLDASGSMGQGNRVEIAREAAESIRRSLSPRDRIAVVHFSTDVLHDFTVDHRQPDHRQVAWSIGLLAPRDSTNVQAGLDLGVQLADRARRERPNAYNYIILMSDGVANVDTTNPFGILESAYDRDSENPLRIIAVGVGIENYNDYLLEQLAQHGNGWYRYLSDVGEARSTFSRENWLALSVPFADQARAQVTWEPEVVRWWRIVGYENRVTPDATFTQDRKEFAELPSGTATTVFYELELHQRAERQRGGQVGSVELAWVDPYTGENRRQRSDLSGSLTTDFRRHADPLLQFGAIVALSADRYSGLLDRQGRGRREGPGSLAALLDLLRPLERDLGGLQSYYDFGFLLERMELYSRDFQEPAPGATPATGYSR